MGGVAGEGKGIEITDAAVKAGGEVYERSEIERVVARRSKAAHGWRLPDSDVGALFVGAMGVASLLALVIEQRIRGSVTLGVALVIAGAAVFGWMAPSSGAAGTVSLVLTNGSVQEVYSSSDDGEVEKVERAIKALVRGNEGS